MYPVQAMHKHKVFISYHHDNDQYYKEELIRMGADHAVFIDKSVGDGEISEDLPDEQIRRKVRDHYLRDSTVTIVLVGTETKRRKHVDWEIYSSMYDGYVNKKSGILVINLPATGSRLGRVAHAREKTEVYPGVRNWTSISSRKKYMEKYPYVPDRIIDNLLADAYISVVPWFRIDASPLRFLIDSAFADRSKCNYDLRRKMRKSNS